MPGGVKAAGGGRLLSARWHRQQQERGPRVFHARDACGGRARRRTPHPGAASARHAGSLRPQPGAWCCGKCPPWVGHAGAVCLGFSVPRSLGTSLPLDEIFPFLATSRAQAGFRAPRGAAGGGSGAGPGCSVPALRCRAAPYGAALRFPCSAGGKVAGAGEAFWGQDVLARPGEGCWGRQGCCRCLLRPPFRLLGLCSARPASPHRPPRPCPVVPLQDGCCKCSQRLGLKKMGFEGEKRVPGDEARADSLPWHARPRHPLGNGRAAGSSAQRLRPGLETPRRGALRAALLLSAHGVKAKPSALGPCPWPRAALLAQSCCRSCSPRRAAGSGGRPHACSAAAAASARLRSPPIAAPRCRNEEGRRNAHGASGELVPRPAALPPARAPPLPSAGPRPRAAGL